MSSVLVIRPDEPNTGFRLSSDGQRLTLSYEHLSWAADRAVRG